MAANNFSTRNMGYDVSDQPRLSNGQFTFKGSVTAATMPSHKQQTALEAPMPVSQNAPLEERMYPSSVADVVKTLWATILPCNRIRQTRMRLFPTIAWG